MTFTEVSLKDILEFQEDYETHPQYIKYQRLLDQYFEIKNDQENSRRKFEEITSQHQKLMKNGIIV